MFWSSFHAVAKFYFSATKQWVSSIQRVIFSGGKSYGQSEFSIESIFFGKGKAKGFMK